MSKKEKTEKDILLELSEKLDLLILLTSLIGKNKDNQKKILKNYKGPLSKREIERLTGVDRHKF